MHDDLEKLGCQLTDRLQLKVPPGPLLRHKGTWPGKVSSTHTETHTHTHTRTHTYMRTHTGTPPHPPPHTTPYTRTHTHTHPQRHTHSQEYHPYLDGEVVSHVVP